MNMFEEDADYVRTQMILMETEMEVVISQHQLNTWELRKDVVGGIRARYAEKIAEHFYKLGAISPFDLQDMHDTMEVF